MIVFLTRQINHIKKRGFKEIPIKFLILIKIIISKIGLIISFPILIIVIMLKPLILIRFGILNAQRIGHFTSNTDLYFFKKKNEQLNKNKIICDIVSYNTPICNKFLFDKIKKIIKLHHFIYVRPIYDLILLLSFKLNFFKDFLIPSFAPSIFKDADHDTDDILVKEKPLIEFSNEELKVGYELLKKMGINNNKFICLIIRDKKYLEKRFNRNDWSYHDHRNIDIDDCNEMINELTELGYYVIRMGRDVEKQISIKNKSVIDYANSEFVSDFADFFLFSRCEFCISSGTGPDMIARIFRKKVGRVMVPIGSFHTSSLDINAVIPHYSTKLKRYLDLKEIHDLGLLTALKNSIFEDKGVKLIKNKELYKNFGKFCVKLHENKPLDSDFKIKQNLFWKEFIRYKKNSNWKINSKVFYNQISDLIK